MIPQPLETFELGPPIQRYTVDYLTPRRHYYTGIAAVILITVISVALQIPVLNAIFSVLCYGLVFLLTGAAAFGATFRFSRQDATIHIFVDGFSITRRDYTQVMRWAEVEELIILSASRNKRKNYYRTHLSIDSFRLYLGGRDTEVIDQIGYRHAALHFDTTRATLAAGEPLRFGSLTLTQHRIGRGTTWIPLDRIWQLHFDVGVFAICHWRWLPPRFLARLRYVPNVHLLMMLLVENVTHVVNPHGQRVHRNKIWRLLEVVP